MRFPIRGGTTEHIDERQAETMLRYALDHGVNYIDTAYPYHGGASEKFLGQVLQGAYSDRAKLATKLPCWKVERADDFDSLLEEQLKRLRRDRVDFYLLHALNEKSWAKMRSLDVLSRAEKALLDGRIGHLGFSFHDKLPVFQDIVDGYDGWTLCQIQYNYVDVDYQAGRSGLRYAAERGLGVVIMEPLRGGQLAKDPPAAAAKIWREGRHPWSPVEWALQWLWDQPEVSLVLSGMSSLDQVKENIAAAKRSGIGSLADADRALVQRVGQAYRTLRPIPCTACGYCLPCPSGVAIPKVFEHYNSAVVFDDPARGKLGYRMISDDQRADSCTACRRCEEFCPQGIEISRWMPKVHELLAPES